MLTFIFSCSPESTETSTYDGLSADAKAKAQKGQNQQESLDSPVLTCGTATETSLEIVITAGATGAAGGFDIHWMTEADFLTNNSIWSDDLSCAIGFSGNGNDAYSLPPNGSISFNLEDLMTEAECGTLECGVTYVFRVRAKNEGGQGSLKKSEWSEDFRCATLKCSEVCRYGLGFWKNHSSKNPGKQDNYWTVSSLVLGTEHSYDHLQLNDIYDADNSHGNGLVNFAQHLISAKLNVALGDGNAEIMATIAAADAKIGSLKILVNSFPEGEDEEIRHIKKVLEDFNGSGTCD